MNVTTDQGVFKYFSQVPLPTGQSFTADSARSTQDEIDPMSTIKIKDPQNQKKANELIEEQRLHDEMSSARHHDRPEVYLLSQGHSLFFLKWSSHINIF